MTQEALKLALEALEACTTWNLTREQFDQNVTAIIVIKKALAQPEQEPLTYSKLCEQEPVQYKCTVIDNQYPNGIPLGQWAKPQRTWVDLTPQDLKRQTLARVLYILL